MVGVENEEFHSGAVRVGRPVRVSPLAPESHGLVEVRIVGIDSDEPPPSALALRLPRKLCLHLFQPGLQSLDALFQRIG
jgi:hypothetical protein